MPVTKIVKYKFMCDSCSRVRAKVTDALPHDWKRIKAIDDKVLTLCEACCNQFKWVFEVLGLQRLWLRLQVLSTTLARVADEDNHVEEDKDE